MKKPFIMLVSVLALTFILTTVRENAAAFGTDLSASYTSRDGQFTVNFPSGWHVTELSPTQIKIATSWGTSLKVSSSSPQPFEPGEMAVQFTLNMISASDDDVVAHVTSFARGTSLPLGEPSEIIVAGRPAARVDGDSRDSHLMAVSTDFGNIYIDAEAYSYRSEFAQNEATLLAIIESVNYGSVAPSSTPTPTSPLDTQANAPDEGGYTSSDSRFSVSYPSGWVVLEEEVLVLASSESALEASYNGEPLQAGDMVMTFVMPEQLSELDLEPDADPLEAVEMFIALADVTGEAHPYEGTALDGAFALVTGDDFDYGELVALQFETGTVLIAIEYGPDFQNNPGAYGETLEAILAGLVYDGQATSDGETADLSPDAEIRQWASFATGTSQYTETAWGFMQATGAPDTDECGDVTTAWASAEPGGSEILALEFEQAVIPAQVNVYQTFNPGTIIGIELSNTESSEIIEVPNSADPLGNTSCPGVFTVDITDVTTPVNGVILYLDQSVHGGWNEIDAIELVGTVEAGSELTWEEIIAPETTDGSPPEFVNVVTTDFQGRFTIDHPDTWVVDTDGGNAVVANRPAALDRASEDEDEPVERFGDQDIRIEIVLPETLAQLGIAADATAAETIEAIAAQFDWTVAVEPYDSVSPLAAITYTVTGPDAPDGSILLAFETLEGPVVFAIRTLRFDEYMDAVNHLVEGFKFTSN